MEKEYSSIRDEIMKWQDRRITFSQIALTLVTAYTGYLISKEVKDDSLLSWQIVSILPLLILSMTMHVTRLFELFHLRAAAFLAVFHDSMWEKVVVQVSFSNGIWKIGYNKSMAIVYCLIACSSVFIFYQKYPGAVEQTEILAFLICVIIFLSIFVMLFTFKTSKEKDRLIANFKKIKTTMTPDASSPTIVREQ